MSSIKARLEWAERLINRATISPCVSTISHACGAWRLDFRTWNDRTGSGRTTTSYHDTEGAAADAYNKLLETYRAKPEPALIVMDV